VGETLAGQMSWSHHHRPKVELVETVTGSTVEMGLDHSDQFVGEGPGNRQPPLKERSQAVEWTWKEES
jgi:hypothetical protein